MSDTAKTKQSIPSVEELLLSGAHFGHQVSRWNPKMAPFIYKIQAGIHIIDLYQTHSALQKATDFLASVSASGRQIIIVGTKGQSKEIVRSEATASEILYVSERWLGGTLTNFNEIKKRLHYLKEYYRKLKTTELDRFTKRERLLMSREADKMKKVLEGILDLSGMPGAVIIIDPHREHLAVRECLRMHIPIVAIADTNCDPTGIDYLIPANDDALRSINIIVSALCLSIKTNAVTKETLEPVMTKKTALRRDQGKEVVEPMKVVEKFVVAKKIDELGLSNRSVNALTKAGIKTLAELKKANLDEVFGLGEKSLTEIKAVI
ncbi:MAG: 30S ribosomal protein S2 [candidate division WWE3 bacterium]|nr:30S ribosomal protein S2 [candidate division WWE3 bacterium]